MSDETKLQKIAEGREAEIFAWEDGTVLRLMRNPDAQRAVELQAEALSAAHAAGVNVPEPRGTATVDGRPGLIMDRLDGPDLLTLMGHKPWTVFRVGRVTGELHADLHEVVAPDHLPDLKETLARRIGSSDRIPKELAEFAIGQLNDLPDGDRLCHGDFHPGNVIEADGIPYVIDWTGVKRGDPMADFARTDLMIRIGDPPPGAPFLIRTLSALGRGVLLPFYKRAYRRARPLDEALATRREVPVAANRLVEYIEVERPKLLKLLQTRRAEA